MPNLEHLMENALVLQRKSHGLKSWEQNEREFKETPCNIQMAEDEHISLSAIWTMAEYVTFIWDKSLPQKFQILRDKLSRRERRNNYGSIG